MRKFLFAAAAPVERASARHQPLLHEQIVIDRGASVPCMMPENEGRRTGGVPRAAGRADDALAAIRRYPADKPPLALGGFASNLSP